MKKFLKPLIAILALVIAITSATAIAFASDEEVTLKAKLGTQKNYNDFEDGATIQNTASKGGAA